MDESGGGVPSGGAPIPSLAWPPEPMGDPASGDEDSLLGRNMVATKVVFKLTIFRKNLLMIANVTLVGGPGKKCVNSFSRGEIAKFCCGP
jgi:hypothetical protein